MPTQRDIAKKLNISRSTVSHALCDRKNINAKTKERVLQMVKRENYVHNVFANAVRSGKSDFIVNIYSAGINKIMESLHKFQRFIYDKKYYCIDIHIDDNSPDRNSLTNLLYSNFFCGILINFSKPYTKISGKTIDKIINEVSVPVVVYGVNCDVQSLNKSMVLSDVLSAYERIITRLYKKGCRRFAYIGIHTFAANKQKLKKIKETLKHLRVPLLKKNTYITQESGFAFEVGQAAARRLALNEIDAVICANDTYAFGFINEAIRLSYNIPEDIKVVGCDNIKSCDHCIVPVTSIDIYSDELILTAVDTLVKKINNNTKTATKINLTAKIAERASTGK